jgi:hypothetical protein
MADQILLYVSAAQDLEAEREVLGRAVSEVPASLGWRIVHSPGGDVPVDLEAVAQADVHLLLLGGDIRAPIGQEWLVARRAGRWPALYLKQGILRTPAAQNFLRYIAEQAPWQPFKDGADLRLQVLRLLAGHILQRAGYYALSPVELDRLRAWRSELEVSSPTEDLETRGGAGESSVILSPERYTPSEGILISPAEE